MIHRVCHTVLSIAAVAVLLGAGLSASGGLSLGERMRVFEHGAMLLDGGRNREAAEYFEQCLGAYPGCLEAFEGLIESYARRCDAGGGIERARILAGSENGGGKGAVTSFLSGAAARAEREFTAAAAHFTDAAERSVGAGDTLSSVVGLLSAARSSLEARDATGAGDAAGKAQALLSPLGGSYRITAAIETLLGEAANLRDRLGKADSLYRAGLELARAKEYRQIESLCLNGLGKVAEKQQRIRAAVELYRAALEGTRVLGATERTVAILNNLGQAETKLGSYETAKEHLEEALSLARSCTSGWQVGYIFYGLGTIAEAQGNREEAVRLFDQSFNQHHGRGNTWGELGARLRLAYNYINLGEYSRAIEHYDRCLEAYEGWNSLYGLSWTLGGLALAHHRLGDFARAEAYYRRTFEVRQRLGDEKGAAWCLNSLGMVLDMQGRYREALTHEFEALRMYEELGDRMGVGSVHFTVGSVYFYLGNYAKSIEHYEQAQAIAIEEGDYGLLHRVVSGMGSVYFAAGRMDLAEAFYLRDLETAEKLGEPTAIIWSLNNLSSFYIQAGKVDDARRYLQRADSMLTGGGRHHLRARTSYLLAKVADAPAESVELTKRSLTIAERYGLEELRWKCLSDLGEYYRDLGKRMKAREYQEQAIIIVESLRHGVASDELRRHMLRPAILPYERMVSLLMDEREQPGAVAEAFGYTERSRAQTLAALLQETFARTSGSDDTSIDAERDGISKLTFLQLKLQDGSLAEVERSAILEEIARLERGLLMLRVQRPAQGYEALAASGMEGVDALAATLGDSERLLAYFLGHRRSYLFSLRGGEIEVFFLPPRGEIEEKVGHFIELLRQSSGVDAGAGADRRPPDAALPVVILDTAARKLYRLLLGPLGGDLESGETLVIVPDGLLHRLPFAVLRDDDGYFMREHAIYYAPSLRSLYYLRRRAGRRAGLQQRELSIVSIGSSGGESSALGAVRRVYPYSDITIEAIPDATGEAKAVADLFERSLALTGGDASERAFKESPLDQAAALHIASHSYVDDENVGRSFIVLGSSPAVTDTSEEVFEDGLLQWHEIAELPLNISIVSLSACKTAAGVLTYGEGITGLSQAFLYAGSSCVLATLTDVPDRFAGRFMLEFYRCLRDGAPAAAALREAQLATQEGEQPGPALWSTFVLLGDGNISVPALRSSR